MKVSNLLLHDLNLSDLDNQGRDEALKEMVSFLKKKGWIGKEKELFEKLLQREELGSTGIRDGVAIPHCKIKSVTDPLVMLAISQKGVDFHAPDGNPSYIFFLVVSSSANPSLNLQILATVAHLVRKADSLCNRLREAEDAASIMAALCEEENRLHG